MFLGKGFYLHSASLHPGVQMATGELMFGVPTQGGEEIFLVTSCFKNRDTWLVCKLNISEGSGKVQHFMAETREIPI